MSITRYHVVACHVLWRELCHYAARLPHAFNFTFLKQGLHDTPELLRQEMQEAVDAVTGEYDAVLLGYGLCSNGLMGITARDKPVVVPRGHDCITILLGSKELYQEYFDKHPGTYWYSSGWIETESMPSQERYEENLRALVEMYGEDNAEYLMKTTQEWIRNYTRATYIDHGIGDTELHKQFTRNCAEWLQWECDFVHGDGRLFNQLLGGDWNEEDFLVVKPGETIVPSHDANVITARAAAPVADGA